MFLWFCRLPLMWLDKSICRVSKGLWLFLSTSRLSIMLALCVLGGCTVVDRTVEWTSWIITVNGGVIGLALLHRHSSSVIARPSRSRPRRDTIIVIAKDVLVTKCSIEMANKTKNVGSPFSSEMEAFENLVTPCQLLLNGWIAPMNTWHAS